MNIDITHHLPIHKDRIHIDNIPNHLSLRSDDQIPLRNVKEGGGEWGREVVPLRSIDQRMTRQSVTNFQTLTLHEHSHSFPTLFQEFVPDIRMNKFEEEHNLLTHHKRLREIIIL
jgi:hypothetical protein